MSISLTYPLVIKGETQQKKNPFFLVKKVIGKTHLTLWENF